MQVTMSDGRGDRGQWLPSIPVGSRNTALMMVSVQSKTGICQRAEKLPLVLVLPPKNLGHSKAFCMAAMGCQHPDVLRRGAGRHTGCTTPHDCVVSKRTWRAECRVWLVLRTLAQGNLVQPQRAKHTAGQGASWPGYGCPAGSGWECSLTYARPHALPLSQMWWCSRREKGWVGMPAPISAFLCTFLRICNVFNE